MYELALDWVWNRFIRLRDFRGRDDDGTNYSYEDRIFCSMLLASFGYLFLSRNTPKEAAEAPWWW